MILRIVILLFFFSPSLQAADFLFENSSDQKQFESLIKEYRCVTCPNQSIADSGAPVAQAMKAEIYRRLKNGETPASIRTYLISRYGEYVVYRPGLDTNPWLWAIPFIMSTIGLIIWKWT